MPRLRKAQRHDAQRLAVLAERTFRDTFGAQNTAEDMDLHCRTSYSESIQDREISSPDMTTFVAEENGRMIGFAQVRRGVSPHCVIARSPGEIQRLYVESAWHGQGIARDLMQACIEEMKRRGSDVIWLGVWERNPRAISFYKKFGFTEVGDHVFPLGRDPQRDIIMVRPTVASR